MSDDCGPEAGAPQGTPHELAAIVARCQLLMAHAWMVRTFVKHSSEVEEFPELMGIVRSVFDISRALETQVDQPVAYLKMLGKKLGKLRGAAVQFRHDALAASTHTNFAQAVISIETVVADLTVLLEQGRRLAVTPPAMTAATAAPTAATSGTTDVTSMARVEVDAEVGGEP